MNKEIQETQHTAVDVRDPAWWQTVVCLTNYCHILMRRPAYVGVSR